MILLRIAFIMDGLMTMIHNKNKPLPRPLIKGLIPQTPSFKDIDREASHQITSQTEGGISINRIQIEAIHKLRCFASNSRQCLSIAKR